MSEAPVLTEARPLTRLLPALVLGLGLALGLGLLPGCGDREEGAAGGGAAHGDAAVSAPVAAVGGSELQPVPYPDLPGADPAVRRQVAEGRESVEALLRSDDPDATELARAYGDFARTLMSYQLTDAADAALANAHRLDPDELRWAYLLGYLRLVAGDQADAAQLMERVLELSPDYLPALVRLGGLRLEAGDEAAARELYQHAERLDDSVAAVHEGLGRAATARGDHEAAVEHFRLALALQPDASSLHYLLGQALRRGGDLEAARRQLAAAGDGAVQLPDPLLLEITGLAESAQFYIIQGGEAAADARWDQAAGAFQKALEIDPDSVAAHRGLGFALSRLGDPAGAERELRLALEGLDGGSEMAGQVAGLLGDLLLTQGRDEEAIPYLRRGIAVLEDPAARAAQRQALADTYARLGRLKEALAEYDAILAAPGGDTAATRVRRATALVNLGRGDEALAEFRRAVDGSPADAGVRLRYAEALEFLGRPGEAEAQRRRARELSASGDQKVARLAGEGRLAASKGDWATAGERYREALAEAPGRQDIRMALAGVLAARGEYDPALAEYQRVLEADPDQADARRGLVAGLILTRRFGPARVEINEALRRSPRDLGLALTQVRLLSSAPDARVRDGALALRVARKVEEANQGLLVRDSLAMALAEAGEVAEAARVQEGVVAEASTGDVPPDARQGMADRLAAYRAGRSWQADDPRSLLALGGGG